MQSAALSSHSSTSTSEPVHCSAQQLGQPQTSMPTIPDEHQHSDSNKESAAGLLHADVEASSRSVGFWDQTQQSNGNASIRTNTSSSELTRPNNKHRKTYSVALAQLLGTLGVFPEPSYSEVGGAAQQPHVEEVPTTPFQNRILPRQKKRDVLARVNQVFESIASRRWRSKPVRTAASAYSLAASTIVSSEDDSSETIHSGEVNESRIADIAPQIAVSLTFHAILDLVTDSSQPLQLNPNPVDTLNANLSPPDAMNSRSTSTSSNWSEDPNFTVSTTRVGTPEPPSSDVESSSIGSAPWPVRHIDTPTPCRAPLITNMLGTDSTIPNFANVEGDGAHQVLGAQIPSTALRMM